ncbi:MAG: glycosyltransferase [Lachnospiraceae bacterium]|nr:glycosyltransferase [Lachnospiraceae bacterium]
MLKFSVIVPVYNVEKYLRTCVDSILCQNIPAEEYEVILINDGSTDNSGVICEEYEKRFPNIILFSQKNKGPSATRNRGLKIAKGKYIIFVDSDDHVQKDTFSVIFQEMEKGKLDALLVNSDTRTKNGKLVSVLKPGRFKPGEVTDSTDYILRHGFRVPVMVWHYVYRRDFLKKEGLIFAEGLLHEDQEWIAHWFPLCKRIGYLDVVFYHYILSDVSIMRNKNLKKCFDLFKIFELIQSDAEEYRKKGKVEVYHVLKRYAGSMMWLSLRGCVAQGFHIKQLIVSEEIRKQMLKYGYPDRRHRFFLFLIWMRAYQLTEILIRLVIRVRGR